MNKKYNWIEANIDINLFGQEDKFNYPLYLLSEQNSFIDELILLISRKKIPVNTELQQYIIS